MFEDIFNEGKKQYTRTFDCIQHVNQIPEYLDNIEKYVTRLNKEQKKPKKKQRYIQTPAGLIIPNKQETFSEEDKWMASVNRANFGHDPTRFIAYFTTQMYRQLIETEQSKQILETVISKGFTGHKDKSGFHFMQPKKIQPWIRYSIRDQLEEIDEITDRMRDEEYSTLQLHGQAFDIYASKNEKTIVCHTLDTKL
jgi:hypothetical protein